MTEIEKFNASIQPYIDGWKSIDMRVVCFQAYNKWVNLATRIVLSEHPVRDHNANNQLSLFEQMQILHEIRHINEIDKILDQVASGCLTIGNHEVQLGKIEGNDIKNSNISYSFQIQRNSYLRVHPDLNYPFIVTLFSWGGSMFELLQHLPEAIRGKDGMDWKLRSLDVPYDGLTDLISTFLASPVQSRGRNVESALFDIIAPIKIRFNDACSLSQGKLSIHVDSIGYEKKDQITVGIIGFSEEGMAYRESLDIAADDWVKDNAIYKTHKEVKLSELSAATTFLRFRGNVIDTLMLSDPAALPRNPRILAYHQFDNNLAKLGDYLSAEGKQPQKDFEVGSALLLHFCGFNASLYGQMGGIQEEIDILAFMPSSNNIIAVECTIKDIDANGKIAKFARRIKEISELLTDFYIVPLIFTALERSMISKTEIEKAKKEEIGVVSAEELQVLFEMADAQKQPQKIFTYLESLLPPSPKWLFSRRH